MFGKIASSLIERIRGKCNHSIMVVELTQQDLKQSKESLKALSRENCRQYLDGNHV